jgi:hypothetical protein
MTKLEYSTHLVQRLGPPPKSERMALAEQVFGGRMVRLSPEGWKTVQKFFSIDYMGAAEYEFGTIPECLKELVKDAEVLRAFTFVVPAKAIEPNWNRKRDARTKAGKVAKKQPKHPPVADREVYVLCREGHIEGVKERILALAGNKLRLKCGSNFSYALDPIGETHLNTVGWLELDNGFFFTIDKDMWRGVTGLFTGKDPVDPTPSASKENDHAIQDQEPRQEHDRRSSQ